MSSPLNEPVTLHYRAFGEGKPVLLLHGMLGAGSNLGIIARHLQNDYKVILPDLRNHGRSPHVADMDYPAMVHDILRLLDSQSVKRCVALGHSMGGKLAMHLALQAPERVTGMVAIDICPRQYQSDTYDEVFAGMRYALSEQTDRRWEVEQRLQEYITDPTMRQFILSNLRRTAGQFEWRVNLDGLLASLPSLSGWQGEGRYTGPGLFIKGGQSSYINQDCEEYVQNHFPSARLKIIEGAGHWVHADKPALLNSVVSRFLANIT